MKLFYINNDGGGFADHAEVEPGTTVTKFFNQRLPGAQPGDYMIRVNRLPASADQVLQEGDRISLTPVKIQARARGNQRLQLRQPIHFSPAALFDAAAFLPSITFHEDFLMPIDRLRLRAAQRVRDAYVTHSITTTERDLFERLSNYEAVLDNFRPVLREALSAGRHIYALHIRRYGQRLIHTIRGVVTEVLETPACSQTAIPDIRTLLEEFDQLAGEFDDFIVDCRGHRLHVTTEPIELEGVYLGPFCIELHWRRFVNGLGTRCFDIEALEPNPSAANTEVTHPHVGHRDLCAGEGVMPIQRALEDGRLADAFCLVHRILTTYNPHSAHVPLEDWGGSACGRCGGHIFDGDSWFCTQCEREVCADCSHECEHCPHIYCRACLIACDRCKSSYCDNCTSTHSETCPDLDVVPLSPNKPLPTCNGVEPANIAFNTGESNEVPLGSM